MILVLFCAYHASCRLLLPVNSFPSQAPGRNVLAGAIRKSLFSCPACLLFWDRGGIACSRGSQTRGFPQYSAVCSPGAPGANPPGRSLELLATTQCKPISRKSLPSCGMCRSTLKSYYFSGEPPINIVGLSSFGLEMRENRKMMECNYFESYKHKRERTNDFICQV